MNPPIDRTTDYLAGLARELIALPSETEWLEFKVGNTDPHQIGEYISALSNAAELSGKANAYLVWGVEDESHEIVGTDFSPVTHKHGNENLENWLLRLLEPKINFQFYQITLDDNRLVILEISRAYRHPIRFSGVEFIRVGSYKKKLKDYSDIERSLWRVFDETPFEEMIAIEHVSDDQVIQLLDYGAYFDLMGLALPANRKGILDRLQQDSLICRSDSGDWNIYNLGAILFGKKLDSFAGLARKRMRVIVYNDNTRINTLREQVRQAGYACDFEDLIGLVNSLLPRNEVINEALRKEVPMYPELAVRELVANALIHQDFFASGTGPMVEIFSDRMEITNPGAPLIETMRFIDSPPISRNEMLASMMRRIGVCEERGSGIDKVVFQTEFYQLPPPRFDVTKFHTKSILFTYRELNEMSKDDKTRACYLHCCLRYVQQERMNNTSLRERLGVTGGNSSIVSRIIRQAVDAKLINLYDPKANRRAWCYIPYWA